MSMLGKQNGPLGGGAHGVREVEQCALHPPRPTAQTRALLPPRMAVVVEGQDDTACNIALPLTRRSPAVFDAKATAFQLRNAAKQQEIDPVC